jgi:hypothetical protein
MPPSGKDSFEISKSRFLRWNASKKPAYILQGVMAKPKSFQAGNTGASALARELKVSVSTVSKKRLAGKTDAEIRAEAAEWHAKEAQVESRSGDTSLTEAKRRNQLALAQLNELELAQKRGELIAFADVNHFVSTMIIRARDILLRIAAELRDRLAAESDPIKCGELIEDEIHRALGELKEVPRA